jgi:hypothetical protein
VGVIHRKVAAADVARRESGRFVPHVTIIAAAFSHRLLFTGIAIGNMSGGGIA